MPDSGTCDFEATLAAVADVLCQPDQWPRFLPHVPHVERLSDDTLRLIVTWRGKHVPTTARVAMTNTLTSCDLTLQYRTGLLRGMREEWQVRERRGSIEVDVSTTWDAKPWLLRRRMAERVHSGVIGATAAQLAILAQSDWRSRGIAVQTVDE